MQETRHKRLRFNPWVGKIPWRRKWQPASVFLPGESHEKRYLVGYTPWGGKESDMTEHTCTHSVWKATSVGGKSLFLDCLALEIFTGAIVAAQVFNLGFLIECPALEFLSGRKANCQETTGFLAAHLLFVPNFRDEMKGRSETDKDGFFQGGCQHCSSSLW